MLGLITVCKEASSFMRLTEEQHHQALVVSHLQNNKATEKYFHSIPNEGKRSHWVARILKVMGLRKGASDLFIFVPRGKYHGMYLELKAKNRKPTKEQLEFLKDAETQGYFAVWSDNHLKSIKLIKYYLNL